MLGPCGMKNLDKLVLKKNSVVLCRQMVVDELFVQYLQENDILTEGMAEAILAEPTSQKRNWHLLSLLPKRGPQAFSTFCTTLKETEQQHLCKQLLEFREQESLRSQSEDHVSFTEDGSPAKKRRHQERVQLESYRESGGEGTRQREVSQVTSTQNDTPSMKRQELESKGLLSEDSRGTERMSDPTLQHPTQEATVPAKRARRQESMEMCLDADSPATNAVLSCTPEFYLSHSAQAYPMSSSPRGLALVLSNVHFQPELSELDTRRGGEVDEEVLSRLFTELDFTVYLHRNLTFQAMRECIEQFAQRPEHAESDCCAVCLLSHGVEGSIYGVDGKLLELDWVFERFDNVRSPLLQNKPKMFFIQACRGEEMDCGVDQLDGDDGIQHVGSEQRDAGVEENGTGRKRVSEQGDGENLRVKLPQRSDMICGFATLKGTAAMRNTRKGSWFIQELNTAMRIRARDAHLSDILVQVNGRIKEREGHAPGSAHHRCKEMSEFTSSLCKDFYLFPKYCPALPK